ncbi:MAG: type II toxin-antitoxin system VapC family toxin [Pyrinomonadaceae bacterium]
MNLLSDTHAFIWSFSNTKKLPPTVAGEVKNPANQVFLSVASVWEMQIKIKLEKMVFNDTLENIITEQQTVNNIQILPVELSHALYLENLPLHHKDPFDRLLISQAIVENMTLVSADANFAKYQVKLLW